MKIAVLGTGMVGRALAGKLSTLGHDVVIGTRNVEQTLARTEPDAMGNVSFGQWQGEHQGVRLLTFADAAAHGDLVVNASPGAISLTVLEAAGAANLSGKVLWDIALPLDLSQGLPPTLTVANTDSLGEQIQRAYPDARVVKALTTVFAEVMVDPARVPGEHNVFVAGEDSGANSTVTELIEQFGWPAKALVDLGGIRGARGVEMYGPFYFAMSAALGTFDFNIAVVRA
ncbi:NAD(P)-binding domain-containing protein [Streptomyces sp. AD681]|uniref:NADPH-dependent F420 reductase n=1 Tax=Streptomyces sp. AD681 TaxID=3019069 RepID=UPI0022F15548|nr:NAD(P)-binding domain-containing protein [Streptomyces sp. AD681]MDA5139917.1 NAD(P)-binding domain-containing protein [Streptomyces sp. AD681]